MDGKHIIFLLCNHRSGSTMLQQILGSHDRIGIMASPWFLFSLSYGLRDLDAERLGITADYNAEVANKNLHAFLANFDKGEDLYYEAANKFAMHLYAQAAEHTGKAFFLDKNIRYHMIYDQMARILPDAKFLLLVRNPAAQFAGMLKWFGDDTAALKARRFDIFTAFRNVQRLYAAPDFAGYKLRYEDFVTAPARELQAVYEFLGLPFQDTLDYGNVIKDKTDNEISGFGDVTSLRQNSQPNSDYITKWAGYLDTDRKKYFARKWMAWAGPDLFETMGYDYDQANAVIPDVSDQSGELEAAWQEIAGDEYDND